MNYNKDSFITGIIVGRQLKGWGAVDRTGGLVVADYTSIHCSLPAIPDITLPAEQTILTDNADPILVSVPTSTFSPVALGIFYPLALFPEDGYIITDTITRA